MTDAVKVICLKHPPDVSITFTTSPRIVGAKFELLNLDSMLVHTPHSCSPENFILELPHVEKSLSCHTDTELSAVHT